MEQGAVAGSKNTGTLVQQDEPDGGRGHLDGDTAMRGTIEPGTAGA